MRPLLLALGAQTRLPIAGNSQPDSQELRECLRWLPLVGAGLGGLLALLAWLCAVLGLGASSSAALLVAGLVVLGAGYFEVALIDLGAEKLSRWRSTSGESESESERDWYLIALAVVTLAILLRVAGLTELATNEIVTTLISALVLSRWTLSLVGLLVVDAEQAGESALWGSYLVSSCGVMLVVALCQGWRGLVLMGLAGLAAWLVFRKTRSADLARSIERGAALALVVEIASML